jgi:hypothetical protein
VPLFPRFPPLEVSVRRPRCAPHHHGGHADCADIGLPQNGQKRTGCSNTASPPPCTGVFATVSLSTPSSMKKCRPLGNDIAVAMFLQQTSIIFSGWDKGVTPVICIAAARK